MKSLAFAGALSCALLASGCAELDAARDWLADPKTQAASVVLERVGTATVCVISDLSESALLGEQAAGAHTGITNGFYVGSASLCAQLSGTVTGTASNVTAVTAVQ